MGRFAWFLLFVVVVAGVWLYAFGGLSVLQETPAFKTFLATAPDAMQERIQAFDEEHGEDFLTYRDSELGFSVKYPIGYGAALEPEPSVYLRFSAHAPFSSSQIIDLRVTDVPFTEEDYLGSVAELSEDEELYGHRETEINGVKAWLFDSRTESPATEETVFFKRAVFDCVEYTVLFTAFVPAATALDLDTVDYMIYSFEC